MEPETSTNIASGDCGRNGCPNVYATNRGTATVRGTHIAEHDSNGEAVVEIPAHLIEEAARALGR